MQNRPSATAVLVSRGIATIAAIPGLASLVPASAADLTSTLLRGESWSSSWTVAMLRHGWFRAIVRGVSNLITPGVFLHLALRKRYIEAQVRAAIAEDRTQVVVLGAGLDTLAVRLAREFPGVRFLEIDHPASQASKRALLPPEATAPTNLRFGPLDLAIPGTTIRDCPEFDPGRATVFVAEGLLMYLPVEAVRDLFTGLAASAPWCRVIFSAMTVQPDGRIGFRLSSGFVDRWLAFRREPFRWGIRPEDLPVFLAPLGFELEDHAEAGRFRRENQAVVGDRPIAEGEHVYVADFRSVIEATGPAG